MRTTKIKKSVSASRKTTFRARLPLRDWVLVGLLLVLGLIMTWVLVISPTTMVFGTIITHVDTSKKVVALTFDDGPLPVRTDETLKQLADVSVKATFFVIGKDAERHQDELKSIVAAGHALGNHGYSHRALVFTTPGRVANEIEATDTIIKAAGYKGAIPFRAPYNYKLVALPFYLSRHDRPDISRDVLVDEGSERSAEAIAADVVTKVKPGSIILLHPMYNHTASSRAAIPLIVNQLRAKGYAFQTIPELLALE